LASPRRLSGATAGKADVVSSRGRMTTATWVDLEGRGGTEAADRQRALAEGGSCGERLVAHKSGREGGREGERDCYRRHGGERERERGRERDSLGGLEWAWWARN
jgi:hypothetical protein